MDITDKTLPLNLFTWATSELSQDAFLAWLLSWADASAATVDPSLHAAGRALLNALLSLHRETLPANSSVRVRRQLGQTDIVAEIDDDLCLAIEDKVHAPIHGDQLPRCASALRKLYPSHRVLPTFFQNREPWG